MITSRFSPLPKQAFWLSENWKLPDRLGEDYSFLELESDEGVPQESSESELFSGLDAVFEILKKRTESRFVVWMKGPFLNDELAPALARICAIPDASPFYIAAIDNTSGGEGYHEAWMSVLVSSEDLRRLASDGTSGDSVNIFACTVFGDVAKMMRRHPLEFSVSDVIAAGATVLWNTRHYVSLEILAPTVVGHSIAEAFGLREGDD